MYTPKMMATMHAMGSRKKAEGGVSLSGSADSARSRIYRAVDPISIPWFTRFDIPSPE